MKLNYGGNKIYLSGAGSYNIVALDIEYRGSADLVATFPSDCLVRHSNSKMIIVNWSTGSLSELFDYTGNIVLLSCKAATSDSNLINISINKIKTGEWELQGATWDSSDSKPDRIREKAPKVSGNVGSLNIIQNNLSTKHGEEWVLSDKKTPYSGSYHVHSTSGQSMTGKTHTDSSENIYLKDSLGRVDYRPKSRKRIKTKFKMKRGGSTPSSGTGGY